jgi:transposase-like protein
MADITRVDLARVSGDNLKQASPDLLRAMVKTFAEALLGAEADARRSGEARLTVRAADCGRDGRARP